MSKIDKKYYFIFLMILVLTVVNVFYFTTLDIEVAKKSISERGLVEQFAGIGYFMVSMACFVLYRLRMLEDGHLFGALTFAFGLRELDFHTRFTTMTFSKTRYYVSPEVPLLEKLIVITFLLFVLKVIYEILRKHLKPFFAGLKNKEAPSIFIVAAFALMVTSKITDRLPSMLSDASFFQTESNVYLSKFIEESMELAIPYTLLLVVFYYIDTYRSSKS